MEEKKRLVVALGGNALGYTPEEQRKNAAAAGKMIASLAEAGWEVIVSHGNGPQVGLVNLAMETSAESGAATPAMPFPECGAMTQGYIGYHLQQAIQEGLREFGSGKMAVSVVTQVEVSADDPAFADPTKPIGKFYSEEEARELAAGTGYTFKEDAGRGWRRVVASPKPVRVVEIDAVRSLAEAGFIVIASGGGGIPVVRAADGSLEGVAAVIDKDLSACKMAVSLRAERFLILTAVENVCLDFGKPTQRAIRRMTVSEAEKHMAEGQFAKGSMLPKVQACVEYLKNVPDGAAIITSIENAVEALKRDRGTVLRGAGNLSPAPSHYLRKQG